DVFAGERRDLAWIGEVAGQRVPVGDEIEAVVAFLQRHPVAQRADQVPDMEAAGRPHAGDNASFHQRVGRSERMKGYGGITTSANPSVSTSAYSNRKPYGRIVLTKEASDGGSTPASTLPPSSGGIGIMLNTASSTFSRISWLRIIASGTEMLRSPS